MIKNRVRLSGYFDDLVYRLDVLVETFINENYYDANLTCNLNKQRDAFLHEIRSVEEFNLKALSDSNIEPGQELSDKKLFPKFCFFIQLSKRQTKQTYKYDELIGQEFSLRLIVTDKYLTEGQIKCYENLVNSFQASKEKDLNCLNIDLFFIVIKVILKKIIQN